MAHPAPKPIRAQRLGVGVKASWLIRRANFPPDRGPHAIKLVLRVAQHRRALLARQLPQALAGASAPRGRGRRRRRRGRRPRIAADLALAKGGEECIVEPALARSVAPFVLAQGEGRRSRAGCRARRRRGGKLRPEWPPEQPPQSVEKAGGVRGFADEVVAAGEELSRCPQVGGVAPATDKGDLVIGPAARKFGVITRRHLERRRPRRDVRRAVGKRDGPDEAAAGLAAVQGRLQRADHGSVEAGVRNQSKPARIEVAVRLDEHAG
mmetsp:Transcript_37690/g.124839  ORF Transcript_37690/g.124839 Transcript_37690/m.124839 type:complete len:266 (+) Transcript_37690:778-1575(+)